MDGELSKVEKLIKTGVCPSATDSSGYTALVLCFTILCIELAILDAQIFGSILQSGDNSNPYS